MDLLEKELPVPDVALHGVAKKPLCHVADPTELEVDIKQLVIEKFRYARQERTLTH